MTEFKDAELIEFQLDELETLINADTKPFTLWERGFIESLRDQWTHRKSLSTKQIEMLKKIHEEKTA